MICLDAGRCDGVRPHGSRTWPTSLHLWPAWGSRRVARRRSSRHPMPGIGTRAAGRRRSRLDELLPAPAPRPRGAASSSRRIGRAKCPGMADAAAEDDPLDVVGHDQQVDGPGERGGRRSRRSAGERVAGGGGLVDVYRGRRPSLERVRGPLGRDGFARLACDRRTGDEGLEAAELAARAARAVGSTMTWPISPARPRAPRWSRPSRMTPAAMPVPTAR